MRLIGNRTVHSEFWAVADDDARTVATRFRIVNRIADFLAERASDPEQLYPALPSDQRAKIDRRNAKTRDRPG